MPTHMTPEAKRALSKSIRALRERLLTDLHEAAEGVYRLSITADKARLDEAARTRRERLETWIDEQVRGLPAKERKKASGRFLGEVVKDAASTLLNRLVFLRLLEASGLREEKVLTGGWESRGYRDFREFAPELLAADESEGYAQLLQLVYDDLAIDLPGLYGDVRLTTLIPVPAATLRAVVEALDEPSLETCWTDDMTLGWVYQYWNDPEREALDAKLNDGGKVEPHEIASKTQMFTERYMVDWLLQNSLGPMWLAMCKKHGWTPEVEADGTLARLEERRVAWRAKRDAGEVSLTELMPLETAAERRWAYYVPQSIPDDAVEHARDSVRDLKILDPAVGSGHFLVVAFDLLSALYREEARQRGEEGEPRWSEKAIVEHILEQNLHGIDLDPRAVQIAAAAFWLKAQQTSAEAHPRQLNLVASNLRLSSLPADDPARLELRAAVERETGIPAKLTEQLLDALAGADHLGSLLQVDAALDEAIGKMAGPFVPARPRQQDFVRGAEPEQGRLTMGVEGARAALLGQLEGFLARHTSGDDLGLRLRGEQLANGVRFVRQLREGAYDLVVANPPYQGTAKMSDPAYVQTRYPLGKADLYAAFIVRGLELCRPGGMLAQVSMDGWMFVKQYSKLREHMLSRESPRAVVDLLWCAFEQMRHSTVAMYTIQKIAPPGVPSVGLVPVPRDEREESIPALMRKRAATLSHVGRHEFDPEALRVIPEWPLVYWWGPEDLGLYKKYRTVGELSPARFGVNTGLNARFMRAPWEVLRKAPAANERWVPAVSGGKDRHWIEPLSRVLNWASGGLEISVRSETHVGTAVRNSDFFFRIGVAFTKIGAGFSGRLHRFPSVIESAGCSVYLQPPASALCLLNSERSRRILQSLNPTTNFTVGDVNRLPVVPIAQSQSILEVLEAAFSKHEKRRESSVEFSCPGPSSWRHAQDWAQLAVDRPEGEPLPPYHEELDGELPTAHTSFALGVALGRFDGGGGGTLGADAQGLTSALPAGTCFLDGTLDPRATDDSLGHTAAEYLHEMWAEHGPSVDADSDLRTWLRLQFFSDVHKGMYENRPIYLPLSSAGKTFVAFISIHRWSADTLRALLAEHIQPARARLEGELADLQAARQGGDRQATRVAERRHDHLVKWKEELSEFIALLEQCAEKGPPAPDAQTPEREVDARYDPDLDDGVMINSAALWPLLEPQWKDPRKWWKQLAAAKGKKDYDWAHLAARYFPTRVDGKCRTDPSLAVAHGCFWKYHPEDAYKWELRLQDEIGPDFTLNEKGSDEARDAFENDHPEKVEELVAAEVKRRKRKRKKEAEERSSGADPEHLPFPGSGEASA